MKLVINLILAVLIGILAFVLYNSINEPIAFQGEKSKREAAVVKSLKNIRSAQELYRGVTGEFAATFDTLREVLNTGSFKLVNVQGDPDDPNNPEAVVYDTILKPAIDSVRSLGVVLEKMEIIPYSDGKSYDISADTLTYQQTVVPVVEVGTFWKDFMGEFASEKYTKYDSKYDPNARMKFGSMDAPQLGGSWD
jgi:hypothetical protein